MDYLLACETNTVFFWLPLSGTEGVPTPKRSPKLKRKTPVGPFFHLPLTQKKKSFLTWSPVSFQIKKK
jgi:hypothetical protein